MARLKERYQKEIIPLLMKRFNYTNLYQVPRIEKVVINVGIGKALGDPKLLDAAANELAQITGQRPLITKARRDIASFKVRKGAKIGCKVTLRKECMYEFLDRLINITLPRIKDFRGLSPDSFDGKGNYTIGITEQIVFPEIEYDKVPLIHGMDITIVTTTESNKEARELLSAFGFPLKR
ncbi:50S ribosomal protein L5 [bacterium]|nr:50S ribosomal protein L5 [bacterium]